MTLLNDEDKVAVNYERDGLLDTIKRALESMGRSSDDVDIHVLGAVDEFHVGGRAATEKIIEDLHVSTEHRILDIGCGLGGPARLISEATGCHVDGVDLTPSYVEAGNQLTEWVGLSPTVTLTQGSALDLPYDDETFDAAYMIHVGMNIEDKHTLMRETSRVLKSGGRFVIYDVTLPTPTEIDFPLPWSEHKSTSFLCSSDTYIDALRDSDFEQCATEDLTDFAIEFFAAMASGQSSGPSPLGLHLLLGDTASQKLQNIGRQVHMRRLAPTLITAHKV